MLRAKDVIDRVEILVADDTNVRWPVAELVNYCRDGVRQIIMVRPDAYPVTRSFTVTGGNTKQVVGMTAAGDGHDIGSVSYNPAVRLLRVTRNIGTAGNRPIREASRVALDTGVPTWHNPPPPGSQWSAQHYVFDNVMPHVFYLYPCPPASPAYQIEVVHSAIPEMVEAGENTSLGLQDHFINPLVDWVLYRAFSKDAEHAGNGERAAHHLNAFATALQVSSQAGAIASSPQAATPLPAGSNWRRTGP